MHMPEAFIVCSVLSLSAAICPATPVEVTTAAELVAAVEAATDGTEIHLAGDRIYDLNYQELIVTNGVRIYGDTWKGTIIRQVNPTSVNKVKKRVITLDHADARLENVTITGGNLSSGWVVGAGVQIGLNGGTVSHCMISNNTLSSGNAFGGGIGLRGGKVEYSYILNNRGTAATACIGGGVGSYYDRTCSNQPIVDTCLIVGNSVPGGSGGGIGTSFSQATHMEKFIVRNCTIANNSAATGGGVYTGRNPKYEIRNCIIAGNTATSSIGDYAPNLDVWSSTVASTLAGQFHTCLIGNDGDQKAIGGTSVLGDPAFKSVAEGDYHLKNTSAARGVGVWYEGILNDLDNVVRTSPNFDCGCYQFVQETSFTVSAAFEPQVVFTDEDVTFTATPDNPPAGELAYQWTLHRLQAGAEDITFSGRVVTRSVPAGEWTATVSATCLSPAVAVTNTAEKTLAVGVRKLYVTSQPNDKAAFPYDTPASAATNLNEALNGAVGGAVVDLDEGVHVTKSEPLVDKGLTIVGRGVDRTFLAAGSSVVKSGVPVYTRVLQINHADAVVSNLTMSGRMTGTGGWEHGSVLRIGESGGTAARCRMTGGSFSMENCYGAGVAMFSPNAKLLDCIVDHCTNSFGRSAAVYCSAGTVRDCLVRDCYSSVGDIITIDGSARFENCTVAGNRTAGKGIESVAVYVRVTPSLFANNVFACNVAPNNTNEVSAMNGKPNWARYSTQVLAEKTKNNCWYGSTAWGSDALTEDPLFRNAAQGDYRLSYGSPCVKRGLVSDWMATAFDLEGKPRLRRGQVDLGCYQADAPGMMILIR